MPLGLPFVWVWVGCGQDPDPTGEPADTGTSRPPMREGPTWYRHVRPLVHHHCGGCHDPGGVADDLPLTTYADVVDRLDEVVASVVERRMPPDLAGSTESCVPRFFPLDPAALDDDTVGLIASWAAQGAPEGDPSWFGVSIPPEDPSLPFWSRELAAAPLAVPAGNSEWCFAFDAAIATRHYVTGAEVLPTAPDAVWEASLSFDAVFDDEQPDDGTPWACDGWRAGQEAIAWRTGDGGTTWSTDAGWRIEPAGRVVLQVRYRTPASTSDAPIVRLVWQDDAPDALVDGTRLGSDGSPKVVASLQPDEDDVVDFLVPAGAVGHVETYAFASPDAKDAAVLAVWPALHAAGASLQLWVDHVAPREGEPTTECLLALPSWSTRLQRRYAFAIDGYASSVVHEGDVLRLSCSYDNSTSNDALLGVLAEEGLSDPIDLPYGRHLPLERCTALVQTVDVTGLPGWPEAPPPVTEPIGVATFVLSEILDHREVGVVKAVEIANIGTAEGSLDGWTLHRFANGSPVADIVPLDGIVVAAGDVAVAVAHDGAIDFLATYGLTPDVDHWAVSGNGDDAYALVDPSGARADVFGEPGVDGSDTAWEYTDGVATRTGEASGETWDAASWTILCGSASASPGIYDPEWVGSVVATTPQAIQHGSVPSSTEVSVGDLVVSAVAADGLFAQASSGGPGSGLWLWLADGFEERVGPVAPGDRVTATGVAEEYEGTTQIDVVGDPRGSLVVHGPGAPPLASVDIDTVLADPAAWESVWVLADGAVAVSGTDGTNRFEMQAPQGARFFVEGELWPLPAVEAGQGFDVLAGPLALRDGAWTVLPTGPADFVPW